MARTASAVLLLVLALPASAGAAGRVSVADPAGGARWSAQVTTVAGGRTCVTLRRGSASRGRTCTRLDGRIAYSYRVRSERRSNPRNSRTVLFASFSRNVTGARLETPDGPRTYRRRAGRPRVLLAVLAGRVEMQPLRVVVRAGGRTSVLTAGPPPAAEVDDPLGGADWRSATAIGSGSAGACVRWERVPPRYSATPSPARGALRCGDESGDLPVASAQVVGRRLVVVGRAGSRVRSVVLRGPDGDRPAELEPTTRAVLAVLPPGTDPAALRLVGILQGGGEVSKPLAVSG